MLRQQDLKEKPKNVMMLNEYKIARKHEEKKKPVAHIYAFALTWLLFISVADIYPTFGDLVILLIISLGVSGIVRVVLLIINFIIEHIPEYPKTISNEKESSEIEEKVTKKPKLDALSGGFTLLEELEAAKSKIATEEIIIKADGIIKVSSEILHKIEKKPELVESIRRFLNYYLPTATKMVTEYGYMEKQSVKGENVNTSMQKIEHGLNILEGAFENKLNTLFSHTALDVATDVDVLENMLKQEGLIEGAGMSTLK